MRARPLFRFFGGYRELLLITEKNKAPRTWQFAERTNNDVYVFGMHGRKYYTNVQKWVLVRHDCADLHIK